MQPGNTPSIEILYEDAQVIVAVKPQGMPSQPDPSGVPDALTIAAAGRTLYPVHRLDRMTGGVMVFARTRAAAATLSRQFADHAGENVGKHYLAVVGGNVTEPLVLRDHLMRDARACVARISPDGGGQEARLTASPIAHTTFSGVPVTLLEVRPETGRFHQIRCQLSAHGFPIVGDGKYGSRVRAPLALFALTLVFRHPVTDKLVRFRAPWPSGGVWDAFTDLFPT